MENSPHSLRQLAAVYCQFAAVRMPIGGIDAYQLALFTLLLVMLCGVAFLAQDGARPNLGRLVPPWLYCLLLILALFLMRLPTFLAGELNPDESMLLAGAIKLRHDPVFWRSLDGTSSGPLNYYPLTLLNLLGLPLDYGTARLMNVLSIGGAISILYPIARLFVSDWAARLAPLPALAAAMDFRSPDFIHYSSECVSALLVAIATWLLLAEATRKANRAREIGIGAVAALIPLAKLQAAPMAAAVPICAVAYAFLQRRKDKWRTVFYVVTGLAGVLALFLSLLLVFGVFDTFTQRYIVNNVWYADLAGGRFREPLLENFFTTGDVMWYGRGIVGFCLVAFGLAYFRGRSARAGQSSAMRDWLRFPDVFALVLLAAGAYAVYRPHRLFLHYFVFLIFPIGLIGALALSHTFKARQTGAPSIPGAWPAVLFVALTVALPGVVRGRQTILEFNSEAQMIANGEHACPACQVAGYFVRPGAKLAVWGWEPSLYVRTRTVPATRDTFTQWQITPGPLQAYYREGFLEDLKRDGPGAFLDAVGPGRFEFRDRRLEGYEAFPALREYIGRNYFLVGDIDGVRIFARDGTNARVTLPFRIRCGAPVSDEAGSGWKADAYFSGGQSRVFQPGASNAKLPVFYRSARVCQRECRYLVPIENGTYLVRMYFAERNYAAPNQRLFNVAVDDDGLGVDVDVFRAAGGAGKPYILERRTTVSNGLLDISLLPKLREAEISALEIQPAPEAVPAKFQAKSVETSQSGPAAEGVTWEADAGWTRNGHSGVWLNSGDESGSKGLLISGSIPQAASGCLVAPVTHGRAASNLSVGLFDVASGQRIGSIPLNAEAGWRFYEIHYDPAATVRLVAMDGGGGRLGVRDPRLCR